MTDLSVIIGDLIARLVARRTEIVARVGKDGLLREEVG